MDVWKEMYLSLMRDTETTIRTLEDIQSNGIRRNKVYPIGDY